MYFITLTGEYTRKTLVEVDTLSMLINKKTKYSLAVEIIQQ